MTRLGLVADATWDRLIELLASGLKVKVACAAVSMNPSVLHRKRLRDDDFRARLAAVWDPTATLRATRARKKAAALQTLNVPAIEQALESGASLRSQLSEGQRRRLHKLRQERPEVLQGRVLQKRIGEEDLAQALAAVRAGHAIGRLRELGLMHSGTLHYHRKRNAELDAAFSKVGRERLRVFTPTDFERALAELKRGVGTERLRALGLPARSTIQRRARSDPRLARAYQNLFGRGNAREAANELQRSLSQNEVWAAVNAAVSKGLPSFVRDDVVSEMVADVLEGYLEPADIRGAAREYVSEHFRQSGGQRMRSLDADVYGDGGRTLHDVLSAD